MYKWMNTEELPVISDPEELELGILPTAFPGHPVDLGGSVSPCGGPRPVLTGPL